jgi:hypothetical protein
VYVFKVEECSILVCNRSVVRREPNISKDYVASICTAEKAPKQEPAYVGGRLGSAYLRRVLSELHGLTSKKTTLFTVTALRTEAKHNNIYFVYYHVSQYAVQNFYHLESKNIASTGSPTS